MFGSKACSVPSDCRCFCLLAFLFGYALELFYFLLYREQLYWLEENAVNRPLVMCQRGVRRGECYCSPMIRSQTFSEPVPLDL